jgi:hypothetical protein
MRYLAGLFDAPGPTAAALAALRSSGVALRDVRVLTADDRDLEGRDVAVTDLLRDRGVPAEAAAELARAIDAGATLLFARAPSARAAAAAAALRGVGALDPSIILADRPLVRRPPANAGDASDH